VKFPRKTAVGVALSAALISAGAVTANAATADGSASPASVCGEVGNTGTTGPAKFIASGVNIRTGPSTSCTSKGQGISGQAVTAYCMTYDSSWTYLRDNATRVTGWVSSQYTNWDPADIPRC
jgi:Bacterial SH3 domain